MVAREKWRRAEGWKQKKERRRKKASGGFKVNILKSRSTSSSNLFRSNHTDKVKYEMRDLLVCVVNDSAATSSNFRSISKNFAGL